MLLVLLLSFFSLLLFRSVDRCSLDDFCDEDDDDDNGLLFILPLIGLLSVLVTRLLLLSFGSGECFELDNF